MRLLSNTEYMDELAKGTGVLHFMGGASSTNGNEILLINNQIWFFEQHEIAGKHWEEKLLELEEEGKKYTEKLLSGDSRNDNS